MLNKTMEVKLEINRLDCFKAAIYSNKVPLIIINLSAMLLGTVFIYFVLKKNDPELRLNNLVYTCLQIIKFIAPAFSIIAIATLYGIYKPTMHIQKSIGALNIRQSFAFTDTGELLTNYFKIKFENLNAKYLICRGYCMLFSQNKRIPDIILPKRIFEHDINIYDLEQILTDNGVQKIK